VADVSLVRIELSGQVVLVTGAGRGIGREIAKMAAEAGAKVVIASRNGAQLEQAASEIRQAGGEARAVPTDVTDPAAVNALVRTTLEAHDRIDVLVNNAATNYVANLVMAKEDAVRALYDVNVFAVFHCTQTVLRRMIRQKAGRIINISSVSAKVGAAYNSAYASSKAALIGFTKSVARETARLGITCNAICPWHVDTELVHDAMSHRAKMFGKTAEEYLEEIVSASPQQRLITAREVGAVALMLMSTEGRGITGQAINVCGGTVMD
jgi:NAD(P)-dependent dehydrogenase (short-subunit alcohol dehydrogenase family)